MSCKRKLSFCETGSSRRPLHGSVIKLMVCVSMYYVVCKLSTLKKNMSFDHCIGHLATGSLVSIEYLFEKKRKSIISLLRHSGILRLDLTKLNLHYAKQGLS